MVFSSTELFSAWYLHRQEEGETFRLVHGRRCAWLSDSVRTCLGEHLFVVVWRVLWHFVVLSPRGGKHQTWFHKPPGAFPRGSVWMDEEKGKGHLRHRVSRWWQDGYMLTFLCVVVFFTLMDQTWKPCLRDVTYYLSVQSVKGERVLTIE